MDNAERDKLLAHFYDLEYQDYADDIDFYVQYALALDPRQRLPVLELGCGTGRISLALAGAGFQVVAVDSSPGMLEVCRKHAEEGGVGTRIKCVQADMRELSGLDGQSPFNMAFCALNTFAYLSSTEQQLATLNRVRGLLIQHGVLILDITPPLRHLLPPSDGEVLYQGSYADPERGGTLHKYLSAYAQPSIQCHDTRIFYDYEEPDGTLRRATQAVLFRWTGRYEMELLLEKAGFRLEKLYGSYELDDYSDDSERMIFVART